MKEITSDRNLTAFCGLYCGACGSYLKEKCPGCAKNEKASWCKIRLCCMDKKIASCAQCADFGDVKDCKKFNNIISRIIGFVLNSDRAACIAMIKAKGPEEYARHMSENKTMRIKRK